MAAPTYFTAAGQPDFTAPVQTADYVAEFALGAAQPDALVIRAPFMQIRANYQRPTADTALAYKPAYTNYITYSEQFDNAAWTKVSATVSANTVASPVDGLTTADSVLEAAATADHYISYAYTWTAATYTASVYLKANGRSWVYMSMADSSNHSAFFNLSAGTIGTTAANTTAAIVSMGNGWYRCSVTSLMSAVANALNLFPSTDGATTNYAGDVTKGFYAFGAQIEIASSVGPYIPTTSTNVTQAAVTAYFVDDTNFRDVRGTLIEFERQWATVPSSWTEPEEYAYIYPAFSVGTNTSNAYAVTAISQVGATFGATYNITASTSNIAAGDYVYLSTNYTRGNQQVQSGSWANVTAASGTVLTVTGTAFSGSGNFTSVSGTVRKGLPGRTIRPSLVVGSSILHDYALTSTTNINTDLPLLQPFAPVVAITGEATTNLTASTLPTSTNYANLVVAGGSLTVECSRRRYLGNIYRRSTRTVPAL